MRNEMCALHDHTVHLSDEICVASPSGKVGVRRREKHHLWAMWEPKKCDKGYYCY